MRSEIQIDILIFFCPQIRLHLLGDIISLLYQEVVIKKWHQNILVKYLTILMLYKADPAAGNLGLIYKKLYEHWNAIGKSNTQHQEIT